MGKISTTWELAKVSWGILRDDKELALLPVLSAICAVLVSVTFVFPFLIMPKILEPDGFGLARIMGPFVYYLANYFVVIFFNTALIHAATIRLRGGHATVADGLNFAWANVGRILQWAVLAATVGMILRALSERAGWIGRIIVGLIGAAWTIATYFVVPVMVYEQLGPIDAVKKSAQMLRDTWGERLTASFSFGLLFFLLALPAIGLPFAVGFLLGWIPGLVMAAICVLYFIALGVVHAALNGIFQAALYEYTRSKTAMGPFTPQMLNSAWQPK